MVSAKDQQPSLSAIVCLLMEVDRKTRLLNQDRLHKLAIEHGKDVRLFCSHDALEFNAFAEPEICEVKI